MKKQRIAFVIGCVLTGSVFFGYETRAQDPASSGQEKTCTDETIVSQLKNDGTPEFVLDGAYYNPSSGSLSVNRRWLDAGDGNVPGGRRFSAAGRKNFR